MVTVFEILPDEILLLICQYLFPRHVIKAFINLNFRLNCTISEYTRTCIISTIYDRYTFELVQTELQSLTVKNNLLTSNEIRTAENIEELNLIRTDLVDLTGFKCLTDLNMHFVPEFPSMLTLYSRNTHIHSIYLEPNKPLTIPRFDPPKISSIKQLAIYVDSVVSFLRILRTCPELTCLNLVLNSCESNFSSIEKPDIIHLSIFSLRFPYEYNIDFKSLKRLLNYLPSTLEYLSITIQTKDQNCLDGQAWQTYIEQTFSQLIRFEFFINFQNEKSIPKLPLVLQTFQNSSLSVNGYADFTQLCIYTEPIPLVPRRRYFLN